LPAFAVQLPLLSLPRVFETTLANVPAAVPYVFPDPTLVEQWRKEMDTFSGFKVGIAWQGDPTHSEDRHRSVPLSYYEPLAHVPGVRLFSLQKGPGVDQLAAVRERMPVIDLGPRLDEAAGPFMDTAAVMTSLDLVITCDTAVAHLAGALGIPVWVALAATGD